MPDFETVQEAAKALLVDAVRCVAKTAHRFAVVGGWSPVLLNAGEIPHPGTADVDLLFEEGATTNSLQEVVRTLLDSGFYPSAKHAFQLIRPAIVAGQTLYYNVDLLHPSEALPAFPSDSDMFVDHIQLEIPLGTAAAGLYRGKSIAAPHSGFVFKGERIVDHSVEYSDLHGTPQVHQHPCN